MDGLKGLPEAVTALFPRTLTQQCIVHLVSASMRYVATKDMKAVAAALKRIYTAASIEDAARELDAFEDAWGGTYRAAVQDPRSEQALARRASLEAGDADVPDPVRRGRVPVNG